MSTFWVRTGAGGSDSDVFIPDLGVNIASGAAWTELSAGGATDPSDGYGQFTARELRDSADLYDLIIAGSLEYSIDGVSLETKTFISDLPLTLEFSDDHFDLTDGKLTLPSTIDATSITNPTDGEIAYDSNDGYVVFYNGVSSLWEKVGGGGGATSHGSLTGLNADDHLQYGSLSGNAARNKVTGTFDFSDGYLIPPTYPSPPVPQSDGELVVIEGILYAYDTTRNKWLSVDRQTFTVGDKGKSNNIYLKTVNSIATSKSGIRALRQGTIVGISIQTSNSKTWTFEVHNNLTLIPGALLTLTSTDGGVSSSIDADFAQGDELQFFANTGSVQIKDPVVVVEVAWRA